MERRRELPRHHLILADPRPLIRVHRRESATNDLAHGLVDRTYRDRILSERAVAQLTEVLQFLHQRMALPDPHAPLPWKESDRFAEVSGDSELELDRVLAAEPALHGRDCIQRYANRFAEI